MCSMPLKDLKIVYGNCGAACKATEFLDNHSKNVKADICVFTEVIQRTVSQRNDDNVIIMDSTHPKAATIKFKNSSSVQFVRDFNSSVDVLTGAGFYWSNMRVMIFSLYLSPTEEKLPKEQYIEIVTKLLSICQTDQNMDFFIILGDFNSYHPTWSKEDCRNHRKRAKGDFLYRQLRANAMFVLNSLSLGFIPTWIRGDTYTVNDLFIGCSGMRESLLSINHEMLNGSDHRLLTLDFSVENALMFLYRNRRKAIPGICYDKGYVQIMEVDNDEDTDSDFSVASSLNIGDEDANNQMGNVASNIQYPDSSTW